MPIYEYKCDNGHVFDVMQKMSEDPLTTCVECTAPVRKVLQPVGISFKGSGFYSTDYSKKGPKEATSTESSKESSKETSKNGGSNDKKSESKTESAPKPSSKSSDKKD